MNILYKNHSVLDQQPPQHWMQYPLSARNPYTDDLHLQDQYQVSFTLHNFFKKHFFFFYYWQSCTIGLTGWSIRTKIHWMKNCEFVAGSHGLLQFNVTTESTTDDAIDALFSNGTTRNRARSMGSWEACKWLNFKKFLGHYLNDEFLFFPFRLHRIKGGQNGQTSQLASWIRCFFFDWLIDCSSLSTSTANKRNNVNKLLNRSANRKNCMNIYNKQRKTSFIKFSAVYIFK